MNFESTSDSLVAAAAADAPELAHCSAFHLGPVEVEPARCELRTEGYPPLKLQPLAMRVLLVLASAHPGTCSRDDLMQSCWPQRIVGDDALHRVISTLRRDLMQMSNGALGIETIPRVGYRLRMEALREATAALASSPFTQTDTANSRPPRRLWPALMLATAGLLAAGYALTSGPSAKVVTIAVVFDKEAREGRAAPIDNARFADGLTGDLARLGSTMPSIAFVEPGRAPARQGLLLRVALEAGAMPAARVRLVDSRQGSVVWSREFAGEDGSLDELRERVANGVTGVVQCGLDRSAEFDDPIGLRLYLGACEGLQAGDFARARAFAQQITQSHPEAAAGWACLANTTIFVAANGGEVDETVLAEAEGYARAALTADAKSGLAYVALAMAASWRGEPMLAILERGLEVDPDFAMLHKHYAMALSAAGMVSQAVDPALRAVALQPHDPDLYRLAVAALVNAGRREEAMALSERTARLWRFDRNVAMQRLGLLYFAPDPGAALAELSGSALGKGSGTSLVGELLAWRADPSAYDWAGFDREANRSYEVDAGMAWTAALTAARMGNLDRAFVWLERAPVKSYAAWAPLFAPEVAGLRRDPRFFAKMASVGLVSRWQKSGRWPDFCADPSLRYDCRASARDLARSAGEIGENGGRTRART